MATVFGKSTIASAIILGVFSLAGCAQKRLPPEGPPEIQGWEWEPMLYRRQMRLAAFEGGAAMNQAGMHHVLTRMQEERPPSRPLDGPNPCRTLRLKIEALERCERDRKTCVFPLPE